MKEIKLTKDLYLLDMSKAPMIVDAHVHTAASRCSNMSPKTLEKAALKAGLEGVVVTDHNTQDGYVSAKRMCRKIKIYPGLEISAKEGEVIALFFEGKIKKGLPAVEVADRIKEGGGLVMVPHPFDILRKGVGSETIDIKPDVVEIFNSRCVLPIFNIKAERFAAENKLLGISGSDAHFPAEVGRSAVRTQGDFEKELRKGKVEIVRRRYSPPTVHLQTIFAKLL
jgi:predicted metal-dependent phosphoesterase TrpH